MPSPAAILSSQVGSIAAHDAAVAFGAMPQILLWISVVEAVSTVAVIQMLEGSGRKPGDFGFDPLKIYKSGNQKKQVRCRRNTPCPASVCFYMQFQYHDEELPHEWGGLEHAW